MNAPDPKPPTMDLAPFIVPGLEILGLLFIFWLFLSIRKDVQPITRGVINGLASKAQSNAALFALAIAMSIQSSMTTLVDLAAQYGWIHAAGWCKVVNAGLGTLIALAVRQGVGAQPTNQISPAGGTAPPFTPPVKPAGS